MNQINRSETLDIAKGIGIILVVVGHSWLVLSEPGILFQIIYSFHVPLFFFLSGIFVKENIHTINHIFRKIESLLKPYFVISILILLFTLVKSYLTNGNLSYINGIINVFYASGDKIMSTPTWFLPSLFITLIAITPLTRIRKYHQLFFLVALLLVSSFFTLFHNAILSITTESSLNINYLPWSIDLLPITLLFVFSGYLLKDFFLRFTPKLVLVSLAFILYILIFSFCNSPALNLHERNFGVPLYSLTLAFSGIYLIIAVSHYLMRYKTISSYLRATGKSTLFILILHGLILGFLTRNFDKLIDFVPISATFAVIFSILIPIFLFKYTQKNPLLSALFLPIKNQDLKR